MTTFLDADDYFFLKEGLKPMSYDELGLFDAYGTILNQRVVVINSKEQKRKQEAEMNKKKGCLERLDKDDMKSWITREGNYFYFMIYKALLQDYPECDATLFRFMYLCTYGNYSGYIGTERRNYGKQDIYKLLMLTDKRAEECVTELIAKELIFETTEGYLINPKYFIRGKLDREKGSVARIFNKGMQELYKKSNYKEHKMLAHFVPLLPYMNIYYNILCHNPEEKDVKKIQALSLKEVAGLFGVDKSNSTRLRKKLVNITVNDYYLLGYFYRNIGYGELKCFIVNPYVFCAAPKLPDMANITNLFDLPDNAF